MPWVRIPPNRLEHLPLFGIDLIGDDGAFAWYSSPMGRMRVEKSDPRVWVDDEDDAIQLGATAVLCGADPDDPFLD